MMVLLALLLVTAQAQTAPQGPTPLSAQAPSSAARFVGRTITGADVYIRGQRSGDEALRELIETTPGSSLSMATVRETIAHIYSLGRYQQVSVEATEDGEGVRLRYHLVPIQNVEEIAFRGNPGLGRRELRRVVTERFGAAPPATRAAAAAELLQRHYFERGYLDAAIRPALEQRRADETVLVFEIESGPRARIRDVKVSGEPLQSRESFLREIHAEPGRVYQLVEVQERLSDYVAELRRKGRYEATASHRMESRSDDGTSVDLTVTIDPGPEVVIRYEGDPLPKDRIEELVPVRREGSVDIDILEDAEQRIVNYLNQQGHWKAAVTSTRRQADGRLEIVFDVRRGPQYRIVDSGVEVSGNASVPLVELRPALQVLEPNALFVAANLDAASSAIRRIYLERGFAQVKVESAANELPASETGQGRVKPAIVITEGPQMRVGDITFTGNEAVKTDELRARLRIRPGEPYFEPRVIGDREAVLREYLNRGFPEVTVVVTPSVADATRVNLEFAIREGTQTFIDHVLIIGNVRTRPEVIRRELDQLQPGQPVGLEALFEARRRLSELGLFRRVQIQEIVHGESGRRDLLVTVEEAPSTTVGYGGGLELNNRFHTTDTGDATERLELAPRGFFEIGRRNIGGKNRSASLYTRLSLRSDDDPETRGIDTFGFPEYRVIGTYREPKTFGWNADVTMTAAVEQGVRSAFKFARKGVNAEIMRRLSPRIRGTARYTFGTTRIFDSDLDEGEQVTIDRIFPRVRLSAFSSSIARDTRDDLLDPARGFFLGAEGTVAARSLGGEVGFIKTYLQAQGYRRLPVARRVVLATRFAVGLADGFPREFETTLDDGTVRVEVIDDLPASERFFAGGDTTVRGFALDSVGSARTITSAGFPRGGNGLVLANVELRMPVWRDFGAAFFLDGGNVFERASQIDLGDLQGSVGLGIRYRSPVGPLRFDVGFKLDPRPIGGRVSRRAFHVSFGQAF